MRRLAKDYRTTSSAIDDETWDGWDEDRELQLPEHGTPLFWRLAAVLGSGYVGIMCIGLVFSV